MHLRAPVITEFLCYCADWRLGYLLDVMHQVVDHHFQAEPKRRVKSVSISLLFNLFFKRDEYFARAAS